MRLSAVPQRVAGASSAAYYLFEYDKRFRCYGDRFVFYDFNHPEALSPDLKGKFKFIFMDPPFLAEACFTESTPPPRAACVLCTLCAHPASAAKAVEFLRAPDARVVVLTGLIMEPHIKRLFPDIHACVYKPRHKRKLQNDFFCCANYTSRVLGEQK